MRKLVVLSFITLDGVVQAPGGPKEDRENGFALGGWGPPGHRDEVSGVEMKKQLGRDYDLLLGRKTFDIFANYWPKVDNATSYIAAAFNKANKYVATRHELQKDWDHSYRIEGDVVEGVKKLKAEDRPELQVHGSSNFVQTLLKHDLVDEMWLKIYPVILGQGKRLFGDGTIPIAFELTNCVPTPSGIIFANYRRNGEVKVGSF